MALSRHNLTPLDGYEAQIDWAGVLDRTNRRLIRWVLGTGLLSFHLAVFGTVLLGAYTWNLISRPDDLHLMGPFRLWGVAALAHTLMVGGGLIGWRLFNMGEVAAPRPAPVYARRILPAPTRAPVASRPSGFSQAWTRGMGSASRVNASARRWAAAATQRPSSPQPPRAANGWPAQPGMAQPVSTEEQRAGARPDVGEATWPDAPPISTALLGTSEHRNAADQVVSVDHREQTSANDDPGRTWVDSFDESRTKDKENRWSWVEAAAASWLSRRELSGKSEKALPAQSEPAADVATPPVEPENSDETASSQ